MEIKDIANIDSNFKTTIVDNREVIYHDALQTPFEFEGLAWGNSQYYRLPKHFTKDDINEGALELAHRTAGCCVRFKSDSPFVAIRAKLAHCSDMNHMPRCGSCGFDLYVKNKNDKFIFLKEVQPNRDEIDLERMVCDGLVSGMNEYIINYPLYGGVEKVEIGLAPGSIIQKPTPHKIAKPILFYGSSITQGACASRPGNAYTSMICRKFDAPQINLGFSGSGKGEKSIAEAIADLDLSCFVMDYDHNATSPEHLEETHERFYKIIREKNPALPILMMSKCDFYPDRDRNIERREVIKKTYANAINAGDKFVAFIDGEELWGTEEEDRDACSCDNCHPNDLGFYRMAEKIYPVLKDLMERK